MQILETICMKCQILFSGKNENISKCHLLKILPRVLNIKATFKSCSRWHSNIFFNNYFFRQYKAWHFMWTVCMKCQALFSWKILKEKYLMLSSAFAISTLRTKVLRHDIWDVALFSISLLFLNLVCFLNFQGIAFIRLVRDHSSCYQPLVQQRA